MANCILSAAAKAVTHTPQYQLHKEARQAILAQSDSARTDIEIERQRIAFCSSNFGCSFGQTNQADTHKVVIVNKPKKGQDIAHAHSASFAAKLF